MPHHLYPGEAEAHGLVAQLVRHEEADQDSVVDGSPEAEHFAEVHHLATREQHSQRTTSVILAERFLGRPKVGLCARHSKARPSWAGAARNST